MLRQGRSLARSRHQRRLPQDRRRFRRDLHWLFLVGAHLGSRFDLGLGFLFPLLVLGIVPGIDMDSEGLQVGCSLVGFC